MELKIIIILACLYVILKTTAGIQRDLYFERLAIKQQNQRPNWTTKYRN